MEFNRVLITGVAGFIGSGLAIHLVTSYPSTNFIGIDKMGYCSSPNNLKEIKESNNWKFIQADFTQLELIDHLFKEYRPEAVIHLGAETHVDNSFGNSIEFTLNNVLGTHVLLEVSKRYGIRRFFLMSTDEIYGSHDQESHEESLVLPTNPYSASKAGSEHLCRAYWTSFKLPIVIVRGNNVIGPRQYPEKVVPRFILRLERGLPLLIQGSGQQRRSFIDVDDMCRAIEIVFIRGKIGEIYNIGSENEISITELAIKLSTFYSRAPEIRYIADRPFNDIRYFIRSEKVNLLGWKPQISLDQSLRRTIQWYRDNPDHWTEDQIRSAKVYDP